MNTNKIQKELVKKIIQACESFDLDKVKELTLQLSFNNEYHVVTESFKNIFQNACLSGDLHIIEYLMSLPDFHRGINRINIITQTLDVLLEYDEPKNYPAISYILNEPTLRRAGGFKSSLDWNLRMTAQNDKLALFQVLLNLGSSERNNKYILSDSKFNEKACQHKEFRILRYMYTTPELKDAVNLESGFKDACYWNNPELLSFLIFECKIEKTPEIKIFMEQDYYEDADRMFKLRELNEQINTELENNPNNSKKLKV